MRRIVRGALMAAVAAPLVATGAIIGTSQEALPRWPAVNMLLSQAQVRLGWAGSFAAHGAVGDGVTDDSAAFAAALAANQGGRVYGTPGKTYRLGSQTLVSHGGTTIDCLGATLVMDAPSSGAAFFLVGLAGVPEGAELGVSGVTIRNCNFHSEVPTIHYAAAFRPGSENFLFEGNRLTADEGMALRGVLMAPRHLRQIRVRNNWSRGIQALVVLQADADQAWSTCYFVTNDAPLACPGNTPEMLANNTTTFQVPQDARDLIAAGHALAILARFPAYNRETYYLKGEHEGGADYAYDSDTGVITFAEPLPNTIPVDEDLITSPAERVWQIRVTTRNPATVAAQDAFDIDISGNVGTEFTGGALRLFCPTKSHYDRMLGVTCPQNVRIANNNFSSIYQKVGMNSDTQWAVGSRVNRVLHSEDFAEAAWTKTGVTVLAGDTHAPRYDNRMTATRLTLDTSTGVHALTQQFAMPGDGGRNVAASIFVRPAFSHMYALRLYNAASGTAKSYEIEADLRGDCSVTSLGTVDGDTFQGAGNIYGKCVSYGEGWYRIWVAGFIAAADAARIELRALNDAGDHSYEGDGRVSAHVWGTQAEWRQLAPNMYMPSTADVGFSVSAAAINVNGLNNVVVAGNIVGPSAGQCYHLEDNAEGVTIAGNACRYSAGVSYYLTASGPVTFSANVATESYSACYNLQSLDPAPPAQRFETGGVATARDINMSGNICDGRHNPAMFAGYLLGSAGPSLKLRLDNPRPANLAPGTPPYIFQRGRFDFAGPHNNNILDNGAFFFDQLNAGAAYSGAWGDVLDRWRWGGTTATATGLTAQRQSATPPRGATHYVRLAVGATDETVTATDINSIWQIVPADRFALARFGTPDALDVAVSFELRCSRPGRYGVALQNPGRTRSYVAQASIDRADEWEAQHVVFPGDTEGDWPAGTSAAAGALLRVVVASGSNRYTTRPYTWLSDNKQAPFNITSITQTPSGGSAGPAYCDIGPVKAEISSVPTARGAPPFDQEIGRVQHYVRKTFPLEVAAAQGAGLPGALCATAASATAGTLGVDWRFDPPMASTPAVTTYNPVAAAAGWRDVQGAADVTRSIDPTGSASARGVYLKAITDALTAGNDYCIHALATARLTESSVGEPDPEPDPDPDPDPDPPPEGEPPPDE